MGAVKQFLVTRGSGEVMMGRYTELRIFRALNLI